MPAATPLLSAALLAAGQPLSLRQLAQLTSLSEDATLRALTALQGTIREAGLGFEIEAVAGGYRFIVPPALAQHLAPILAPPPLPSLSPAALEVLAIIAYRQPVTRAEIEAMRGGSAGSVLTLQERELVKVVGKSPAIGQPLLYGTTERFLLEFGLKSLDDLPEIGDQGFAHLLRS